jgi:uncharacterized membrane protein
MGKGRIEAFSDGVIAIIITIMVLELKPPHEPTWTALCAMWPKLLSYLLSFAFVGVYWTNHHHLVHTLRNAGGAVIWLNLHLLLWMSIIPLVTAWLGETYPSSFPTVVYGIVMLMCGVSYSLLQLAIARQQADDHLRATHRRHTRKGVYSLIGYSLSLPLAYSGHVNAALVIYGLVALSWARPERGFEHAEH